jgi:hypothetical protein
MLSGGIDCRRGWRRTSTGGGRIFSLKGVKCDGKGEAIVFLNGDDFCDVII